MKTIISLRQLAKELGVSASYLSQVKNGKRPASAKLLNNPDVARQLDTTNERPYSPTITNRLRCHCATRARLPSGIRHQVLASLSIIRI